MIALPGGEGAEMSFDGDLLIIKKTSKQFHRNQNLPVLRQPVPLFAISLRT